MKNKHEQYVAVAAASIADLRRSDVYRVLDEAPVRVWRGLAAWIAAERPDLAEEVGSAHAELRAEWDAGRRPSE